MANAHAKPLSHYALLCLELRLQVLVFRCIDTLRRAVSTKARPPFDRVGARRPPFESMVAHMTWCLAQWPRCRADLSGREVDASLPMDGSSVPCSQKCPCHCCAYSLRVPPQLHNSGPCTYIRRSMCGSLKSLLRIGAS